MSAPCLEACYFGPGASTWWARMAAALQASVAEHCPTWQTTVRRLTPAPMTSSLGIPSHVFNSQKLAHWRRVLEGLPDGARLALFDVDLIVLRSLDDVWDQAFDVAITVKPPGAKIPLNGGVVFVKVNAESRAFFEAWERTNHWLLRDSPALQELRYEYGGINQSALGYLLRHEPPSAHLHELPCREWNCEDESWETFDDTVRILHIKGRLREEVFGAADGRMRWAHLVRRWQTVETTAQAHARRVS